VKVGVRGERGMESWEGGVGERGVEWVRVATRKAVPLLHSVREWDKVGRKGE
jgi:hypothetical protein